jgi:hypothetical protein
MRKVYVSGKITGLPKEEVQRQFNAAVEQLTIDGVQIAVNPVALVEIWEDVLHLNLSYKQIMVRLIDHLAECDAIYMLRGWATSPGAKAELAFAEAIGLNVMYWYGDDKEAKEKDN